MATFSFKTNEPKRYITRNIKSNIFNAIVCLILGLIIAKFSSGVSGAFFGCIVFIIQFFKSKRWDKYFIKSIALNENNLIEIIYQEESEEKELCGENRYFKFKKESAFNKTQTYYLAVYYKDELKIKQFEIGEWTTSKFDEIIEQIK